MFAKAGFFRELSIRLVVLFAVFSIVPAAFAGLDGVLYVVDSVEDTVGADGVLTLREAVQAASGNVQVFEAPAGSDTDTDIITFDPAIIASGADIYLVDDHLELSGDLYIEGSIINSVTIHAADQERIINIPDSDSSVILVGLELTGGDTHQYGGAVYSKGSLDIIGCAVNANNASRGGGIYNDGGDLLVYGSEIINNTTSKYAGDGGGIYCSLGSLVIDKTFLGQNIAYSSGGALYVENSTVDIYDSEFVCNTSSYEDSSDGDSGGAIYGLDSCIYIDGCEFTENVTGYSGGAIFGNYCEMSIVDSDIIDNSAKYGGGIAAGMSDLDVSHCQISYNYASRGGGLNIGMSDMEMSYCLVSGNQASWSAGGMSCSSDYDYGNVMNIQNSLIVGNNAKDIGAIRVHEVSQFILTNTTVAGNYIVSEYISEDIGGIGSYGDIILNNSIVTANYVQREYGFYEVNVLFLWYDDSVGRLVNNNSIVSGNDSYGQIAEISTDVGFVRSPSAGVDGQWGTEDDEWGDLHLSPVSIAINTGDNDFLDDESGYAFGDFDGNPRICWDRVDIGAFEYQDEPSPDREGTSATVTITGDIVDFYDGEVSLREAVLYSNFADGFVDFSPSLSGQQIELGNEDGSSLGIGHDTIISGKSIGGVIIDLSVSSGLVVYDGMSSLTLVDVKLLNGSFLSNPLPAITFNGSRLEVIDSVISGFRNGVVFDDYRDVNPELHREFIIKGSLFKNNISRYGGSGVNISGINIDVQIFNSVFVGNRSSSSGGAVYVNHYSPSSNTGPSISIEITNSTIAGNDGGGIYSEAVQTIINNSIITMNSLDGQPHDIEGDCVLNSSIVGVDPGFVRNPYRGDDGLWGTDDDDLGDLHITQSSPAFDAGDDLLAVDENGDPLEVDIAGMPRIMGESVDIGAYEVLYGILRADINGDDIVNIADFLILKGNYGMKTGATYTHGDIDGDGDVDISDFLILKSEYGSEL